MSKQIDAIKKALEVLEDHVTRFDAEQFTSVCELDPAKDAIIALREALAEQSARDWVGLTDEDKEFIAKRASVYDWHDYEVIEASEAKLKEKNT